MRKQRRIWPLIIGILGVLLVAGSFVFRAIAETSLVKYPDDVDETPVYQGTVTLHVDPATAAPLDSPKEYPLEVRRHIQVVESTSELAVVKETIDLKAEGLFDSVQENQYVMDRKEMVNVQDPRAYAYLPENVVDRSPDYRLNFPLDNELKPYPVYLNEAQITYQAQPDPATPSGTVEDIDVHNFVADVPYAPVTEAYLGTLDNALPQKLPRELSLTQLAPLLAKSGIDIQKLLPALLPALSPADQQLVGQLAQQPVKLVYQIRNKGSDSVDQSTGAIVQLKDVEQSFAASPDPEVLPVLQGLLGRYPQVAGVSDALTNLQKLAAAPIPIFDNKFSQTPASVTDIAKTVKDTGNLKTFAEDTLPLILLIAGIVLAVVGFGLFVFWPKRVAVAGSPPPSVAGGPAGSADGKSAEVGATRDTTDPAPTDGSMEPPPAPPPGGPAP
jgi:hypothetical protein